MDAPEGIDPTAWLDDQLAAASPDLLRTMVKTFAGAMCPRRPAGRLAPTTAPAAPMA
jgi:hypothetical protein